MILINLSFLSVKQNGMARQIYGLFNNTESNQNLVLSTSPLSIYFIWELDVDHQIKEIGARQLKIPIPRI